MVIKCVLSMLIYKYINYWQEPVNTFRVAFTMYFNGQGSHLTLKTLKKWNFVIFFSKPRKCLSFAQKVLKTWNFTSKLWKNLKFANSMFQASLFNMSFTKIILIYLFVISTLSNTDSKPNWPWISLLLPGNNLENTWNFASQEKWEPCICFNTFRDFYN